VDLGSHRRCSIQRARRKHYAARHGQPGDDGTHISLMMAELAFLNSRKRSTRPCDSHATRFYPTELQNQRG